jgi:ribonuclease P protein component
MGGIVLVQSVGVDDRTRVGFIVSKTVGNAVARNRAKRRLRHTAYEAPLQPGMDYVIIARKSVLEVSFETLKGWFGRALSEVADV